MSKTEAAKKTKMATDVKVVLIAIALFVAGFTGLVIYLLTPKPITVATVEKNKITNYEFMYYLYQNASDILQYKTDPNMDDQTFLNSSYGSGTVMDSIKQKTITQTIQIELLLLKAESEGFKVPAGDLDIEWKSFVNNTLKQNAVYAGLTLEAYAKKALGMDLGKAEKIYKDYIKSQKYFEAQADKITVDQAKLDEYYQANKKSLDHATIRHILVSCKEGADEAIVAEKKKLAEEILAKVNNGGDFEALAKEYSEDPGSKDNGGVYEIKPDGQMVPEFEQWTFTHRAGDTGIVQTTYGFHIMKLDSIYDTLESQRKDVEKAYKISVYQSQIDELMNSGKYKINVDNKVYSSLGI